MKSFLHGNAKDKVLTAWQSLKMMPHKNIDKYIEKFWDSYLKATVYQSILFAEQKQQFCAGLSEKMNEYVHLQWPKSINVVNYHALVALQRSTSMMIPNPLKGRQRKSKKGRVCKHQMLPRLNP